jgi:hypothetical protein
VLFHGIIGKLELLDVEGNREAVGIEFDEEGVFVLEIQVTAFEVGGDEDGEESYVRLLSDFEGDDAAGGFDIAIIEFSGDLIDVAGEAAAVFNGLLNIERGSIEARGLAIENPVSASEEENKNDRSDEEGLSVNA